jgi:hypothetical protein
LPSANPRLWSLIDSKPKRMTIQSPCTKVCTLDARTGLCLGCGRTVEEIARWSAMSEAERARIMAELPGRRARHGGAAATTSAE